MAKTPKPKRPKPRHEAQAYTLTHPRVSGASHVDWSGGRIVVPPTVRVKRLLPGRGKRPVAIPMDLRSFVSSDPSSVVTRWIDGKLEAEAAHDPDLATLLANRRTRNWFDATAHLVADIVFRDVEYREREGATWQLPEETLALLRGDCEDRATLLASALVAAGISPYNVRVALGHVTVEGHSKKPTRHAHAWVVYRSEAGAWTLLEPVPVESQRPEVTLVHAPDFVFNGDHLWTMRDEPERDLEHRWNSLDSRFHGETHKSLVEHAASLAGVPDRVRTRLARTFTYVAGQVIDEPDVRFRSYDPRDHFDSGLVDESWEVARARLATFRSKSLDDEQGLTAACWAFHAIADFYAHSTYAHFLSAAHHADVPYDPESREPALGYDYANDPIFQKRSLSHYEPWWKKPSDEAQRLAWGNRLISGRYSLHRDSHSAIEKLTNEPSEEAIPKAKRPEVGALPHHDEIAVDVAKKPKEHELYDDDEFAAQFKLRYSLALEHLVRELRRHPGVGGG